MPQHPGIKAPRSTKIGIVKSKPKRKPGPRKQGDRRAVKNSQGGLTSKVTKPGSLAPGS